MACLLTGGKTKGCRDSVGGITEVYMTELANKATLTAATEGLISAFTLLTTKQFWKFELEAETSDFVENIVTSRENGTVFYETDLNLVFNKWDVAGRNMAKLMAQSGGLMIIIKTRNGDYLLMGEVNGAMLDPSKNSSGRAMGDRNGFELVFKAKEPNPMQGITAGLIAALLAPAA